MLWAMVGFLLLLVQPAFALNCTELTCYGLRTNEGQLMFGHEGDRVVVASEPFPFGGNSRDLRVTLFPNAFDGKTLEWSLNGQARGVMDATVAPEIRRLLEGWIPSVYQISPTEAFFDDQERIISREAYLAIALNDHVARLTGATTGGPVVPEPTSVVLVASGLAALGLWRRAQN